MTDPAGGPPSLPPEFHPEPPPSYPAPAGYFPAGPPGYSPASPPGYHLAGHPAPALKPGIIPLRPLTLTEIFNGAVAYIRKNPKAALGMTAAVVVVSQLLGAVLELSPLLAPGRQPFDPTNADTGGWADTGSTLSAIAGGLTAVASSIVLSGLLTVVVGRAVFGATISPGAAWRRARGRLLPLFGLAALQLLGTGLVIATAVGATLAVALVGGPLAAVPVGVVAAVAAVVAVAYAYTVLLFAPVAIVLEQRQIGAAVTRSFALVRRDFWRVFGIGLLASVAAALIGGALSTPFSVPGQVLLVLHPSTANAILALALSAVGGAVGQIVTAPFNAGVVVLLYADRRMRAEAFDLVLQTGATAPAAAGADATDALWLTAHP